MTGSEPAYAAGCFGVLVGVPAYTGGMYAPYMSEKKMDRSETLPVMKVTPFEMALLQMCAERQGVNRTLAARRAMVRGAGVLLGKMPIAKLREKHGLTYDEMLVILEAIPDSALVEPEEKPEEVGF